MFIIHLFYGNVIGKVKYKQMNNGFYNKGNVFWDAKNIDLNGPVIILFWVIKDVSALL